MISPFYGCAKKYMIFQIILFTLSRLQPVFREIHSWDNQVMSSMIDGHENQIAPSEKAEDWDHLEPFGQLGILRDCKTEFLMK